MNVRKLAALEVLFLGPALVLTEYACGVFLSAALGVFVLVRGHSSWQTLLGIYLVCLGISYVPLLIHAISLRREQDARQEIAGELSDTRNAFSSYRTQTLLLLVPLFVPILALVQTQRGSAS